MTETAQRIVLASRPVGEPTIDNFRLEERPTPSPGPGQMLLLSLDPYMRGRMSDAPSYAKPVGIGDVMEGGGELARSRTWRRSALHRGAARRAAECPVRPRRSGSIHLPWLRRLPKIGAGDAPFLLGLVQLCAHNYGGVELFAHRRCRPARPPSLKWLAPT
jgi:hypothetical protein